MRVDLTVTQRVQSPGDRWSAGSCARAEISLLTDVHMRYIYTEIVLLTEAQETHDPNLDAQKKLQIDFDLDFWPKANVISQADSSKYSLLVVRTFGIGIH